MTPNRGFVPGRLRQAMQRSRVTAVALAQALQVADNTVSRFLSGQLAPRPEVLRRMAEFFHEPIGFFLRPLPTNLHNGSPSFMRSYAAATKRARLSAQAIKDRTREVTEYIERHVELPPVHFPSFRYGDDPAALSRRDIENAARETRRFWGLGDGPIANVVSLLEHNGAVVVRVDLGDETLNAFSQWGEPEDRPYIVLGDGRGSATRSRFDACHELAHMVAHRHLPSDVVMQPEVHRLVEKQANRFAGAFLMPAESFSRSVYLPTLSALKSLKPVWGASVSAMIMRLSELEMISERQAKRLWEAYAPWRNGEPCDDEIPMESPSSVRHSFDLIRAECGISPSQLATDIPFAVNDICAIGNLPLGWFADEPPRIRVRSAKPPTVLQFRRSTPDGAA